MPGHQRLRTVFNGEVQLMFSCISRQRKIVAHWNFEHKAFLVNISMCAIEIGVWVTKNLWISLEHVPGKNLYHLLVFQHISCYLWWVQENNNRCTVVDRLLVLQLRTSQDSGVLKRSKNIIFFKDVGLYALYPKTVPLWLVFLCSCDQIRW